MQPAAPFSTTHAGVWADADCGPVGEAWQGTGVRGWTLNNSPSVVKFGTTKDTSNTSYGYQVEATSMPVQQLPSSHDRMTDWHLGWEGR